MAVSGKCATLSTALLRCSSMPLINYTPVMYMRNKHYDPKFREQRRAKVLKNPFVKDFENRKLSPDEIRKERKKMGTMNKGLDYFNYTHTGGIFDPYIPPEGDGKVSPLSKSGLRDMKENTRRTFSRLLDNQKMKKYQEGIKKKEIVHELQELYIAAQKLFQNLQENKEKLSEFCTPQAIDRMTQGLTDKTVQWEFVESIEPPKVVHYTCNEFLMPDNMFGQVTLRLHSKQKLAIYDRFGRLMYGHPSQARDVLEYVVFEKHVANIYGKWRVHEKIIPEWMPDRPNMIRTTREREPEPEMEESK